jgi:hypothetical protein
MEKNRKKQMMMNHQTKSRKSEEFKNAIFALPIDFQKMNFTEECKVPLHEIPHPASAREPCTPLFGQTLS